MSSRPISSTRTEGACVTDLSPLTALGTPVAETVTFGALTLRENATVALASVSLRRGAATPAPFGLVLPAPRGWVRGDGVGAFWTGPGQWMIEGEGRAAEDFAAALVAHCPGCSVTEQTDGFVVFEMVSSAGPAPIDRLLERLVNIDTGAFGPGSATRTGFEHMSIFVIRRAAERVAVLGLRSAAGSIWHGLTGAAERMEGTLA